MRSLAHKPIINEDGTREYNDILVVEGEVQLHRYRTRPKTGHKLEKHYDGEWRFVSGVTDFVDHPPSETFGRSSVDVGHSKYGYLPAPTTPNGGPE